MAIRRLTAEQAAAAQRADRERFEEWFRPPELKNGEAVRGLTLPDHLDLGVLGMFSVPPVPYRAGVRLTELRSAIEASEDDFETARLFDEAAALFKTLVVPESRIRRWLWRWWPNPFRYCSDTEVGHLLGFFSACRTKSRVRPVTRSQGPRR